MPHIPIPAEYKAEEFAQIKKLSAAGFAQTEATADIPYGKLEQAANARGDLWKTVGGEFALTVKTTLGFHGNPQNTGAFPKRLILGNYIEFYTKHLT